MRKKETGRNLASKSHSMKRNSRWLDLTKPNTLNTQTVGKRCHVSQT